MVLVGGSETWIGLRDDARATSATTVPPVWMVPGGRRPGRTSDGAERGEDAKRLSQAAGSRHPELPWGTHSSPEHQGCAAAG